MKPTLLISAILAFTLPSLSFVDSAAAQVRQVPQVERVKVPDDNTLARLVWSTLVALDNANRTGNYEVLHGLGADGFQKQNSVLRLSQSFADLRNNRVDVGRTILSSPTYYQSPEILADGSLRLRGGFDFRPKSIRFDLIYTNIGSGWHISAISVVEMDFDKPR